MNIILVESETSSFGGPNFQLPAVVGDSPMEPKLGWVAVFEKPDGGRWGLQYWSPGDSDSFPLDITWSFAGDEHPCFAVATRLQARICEYCGLLVAGEIFWRWMWTILGGTLKQNFLKPPLKEIDQFDCVITGN